MKVGSDSLRCRVVLLGDSSVGKTSILSQLVDHRFSNEEATIGANYQIYIEEVNNAKIEMQIWDTAGQEKFRSLGSIYYRNASAGICVFDITHAETYKHVDDWIKDFHDINPSACLFIAANKADEVDSYEIALEQAEEHLKQTYKCEVFKTSAKTGQGISEMFTRIAHVLLETNAESSPSHTLPQENDNGCGC